VGSSAGGGRQRTVGATSLAHARVGRLVGRLDEGVAVAMLQLASRRADGAPRGRGGPIVSPEGVGAALELVGVVVVHCWRVWKWLQWWLAELELLVELLEVILSVVVELVVLVLLLLLLLLLVVVGEQLVVLVGREEVVVWVGIIIIIVVVVVVVVGG